MPMSSGSQPPPGPFARAVANQVQHALVDHRVSQTKLAEMIDRSQSYVSKRLRNEAQFTANDIEDICRVLDEDILRLLARAIQAVRR